MEKFKASYLEGHSNQLVFRHDLVALQVYIHFFGANLPAYAGYAMPFQSAQTQLQLVLVYTVSSVCVAAALQCQSWVCVVSLIPPPLQADRETGSKGYM